MLFVEDLAEYVVFKSNVNYKPLTNAELNNLLYILYREYLKEFNKDLFFKRFEPWKLGPAIEDIYSLYLDYGPSPIQKERFTTRGIKLPSNEFAFIEKLIEYCFEFGPYEYLEETQYSGSPWSKAVENNYLYLERNDILNEKKRIKLI